MDKPDLAQAFEHIDRAMREFCEVLGQDIMRIHRSRITPVVTMGISIPISGKYFTKMFDNDIELCDARTVRQRLMSGDAVDATYVGRSDLLRGETALVRYDPDRETQLLAQFDAIVLILPDGTDLSHGWHAFCYEAFEIKGLE